MTARRRANTTSSRLSASDQEFIRQMGLQFSRAGAPAIAGKLFAAVMLMEGPVSLSQLAQLLGASKASISTNVRMIEQGGFLTRTASDGRQHFYEVRPDAWDRYFDASIRRMQSFTELCAQAARAMPAGRKEIKDRLLRGVRTMELMQMSFSSAVARTRRRLNTRRARS